MSCDGVRVAQPLFPVEGQGSTPMSPLQLEIVVVDALKAIDLNRLWHSTLPKITSSNIYRNTYRICFGALYKNCYFAVAIWTSPVAQNRLKNGFETLELRRLAISNSAPKNTASRMLSVMCKIIKSEFRDVFKLISYQDTGQHIGTIYKASGLKPIKSNTKFLSWENRPGRTDKTDAPKIRWEKQIRPEPENDIIKNVTEELKRMPIQQQMFRS